MKDNIARECFNKYVNILKRIDFEGFGYEWISNDDLEEMDRMCYFDMLHCACRYPERFTNQYPEEPFIRLVGMEVYDYNVILTSLPSCALGYITHASSYTLTEYRNWAKYSIKCIIDEQIEKCHVVLKTSAGYMRVLNKPIVLGVRTKTDLKHRQVGDTTPFEIIGIIEDSSCRDSLICL